MASNIICEDYIFTQIHWQQQIESWTWHLHKGMQYTYNTTPVTCEYSNKEASCPGRHLVSLEANSTGSLLYACWELLVGLCATRASCLLLSAIWVQFGCQFKSQHAHKAMQLALQLNSHHSISTKTTSCSPQQCRKLWTTTAISRVAMAEAGACNWSNRWPCAIHRACKLTT